MLVHVTFVRVVKVTIVQVVGVTAVTYRGMSTTWPMLMRVVGVGWGGASRHETASFRSLGGAARNLRGDVYGSTVGKSGPVRKGDPLAHVRPRMSCRLREPLSRERRLVLS